MRFFTIGHGTARFGDLRRILEHHGVATIVDVRSEPWSSRAPDFTKRRLEGLCATVGFGYRWLGDGLGGRPRDPALCRPDGSPDYDGIASSPGFVGSLYLLEQLAAGGGVALLCAEADPAHCHRSALIAPALAARGHEVMHLLHDGNAVPDQPTLDL
jgi:uncharacterized protein (DUF488 family)